jgi:hypothetical protein
MTSDVTIVSAVDKDNYKCIKHLIRSIQRHSEGKAFSISILDLGCTLSQLNWLKKSVDSLIKPQPVLNVTDLQAINESGIGLFKPFLPSYFPDYEIYIWMDAILWIQDWEAVSLYIKGALKGCLSITPEIHPAYSYFYNSREKMESERHTAFQEAFGREAASKFFLFPMVDTHVFAMSRDHSGWRIWAECLQQALDKPAGFTFTYPGLIETVTLNFAIFTRQVSDVQLLPSWCNWKASNALPLFNEDTGDFVEPFSPHTKIGIIQTDSDPLREYNLRTTRKEKIVKCLTSEV